ncbi:hypothetical protein K461DRAFT_169540 [Myriangium duriaei CBS 260.36]|uniref:Uncharacterized protein n=1 Tax=Myriangium duriaei CBS 260.36 TaxID=1168546 RepID=A0A9P4J2I3_9PEZI|nr:hypothetical protein K461DRAFT_169540 [Myriangium duriaei CBS 260.36]
MKTVPTIVASSSAVAASALGLAFVRQEYQPEPHSSAQHPSHRLRVPSRRSRSAPMLDMTSTATCTLSPVDALASPHSFTFAPSPPFGPQPPQNSRSTGGSRAQTPNYAESELEISKRSLKRSLGARDSTHMSMESAWLTQEANAHNGSSQVTQSSWSKRLSTFSSNGSISSSPRPPSATFSHSNGSVAFSNAGSTAPMFPSFVPAPAPPNKLVKRSSSVRSTVGGSRIPLPTFKKPATSHERDGAFQDLQRRPSTATSSIPFDSPKFGPAGSTWKTYFTPKVSFQSTGNVNRRSSTSIPNPIKRVIPDRRYHPVLVSGSENVRPGSIDFDRASVDNSPPRFSLQRNSISMKATKRFFSSPLPQRPSTASTSTSASFSVSRLSRPDDLRSNANSSNRDSYYSQGRGDAPVSSPVISATRPFSPTDLVPTPLPKWKRPSKLRGSESKNRRKGTRSASGSDSLRSEIHTNDAEPPTKKRDVSGTSRHPSLQYRDETLRSPIIASTEMQGNRSVSPAQTKTLSAFATNGINKRDSYSEHTTPQAEGPSINSPTTGSIKSYRGYPSATLSEITSSFAGSDSDARYIDDEGFESPNDTLFDSVRTRATSASSTGFKGPRIDAIFDDNRAKNTEWNSSVESNYHSPKILRDTFDRPRHSIIEEEESVATPVRSQRNGSAKGSPETYRIGSSPKNNIASSPPPVPSVLRQKPSFEVGLGIDDKDDVWDFGDDEQSSQWPTITKFPQFDASPSGLHPNLNFSDPHGALSASPSRHFPGSSHDARSNIFDWSEQQHLEKSPAGNSPPRPRTVHGKKDAENRGSRSVGRRAPSGLHIRSQSVPVAPEMDGKRSQVVTNKFGTWGVGSKGVTEDWNEDFDFEEPVPPIPLAHQQEVVVPRTVSEGMQVPKAIKDQQEKVLANIGLLRDWGLLIEELKELRGRAQALNLREANVDDWKEVDAMIDLADHESNDHTLDPRQSPPSSPTFDYSAFDDPVVAVPMRNSPRPAPKLHAEDIFESPNPSPARKLAGTPEHPSPRRPRKDSEAVARSVIEALQQRRNISDPTGTSTGQASKKVPFDTATLKRIVPYVQELRDKIKKSIREVEGLYSSPRLNEDDNPSFSRMFQEPPESPTAQRSARRSMAHSDRVMSDDSASRSPPDELSRRMALMTVG